jgi:hypothetical protein
MRKKQSDTFLDNSAMEDAQAGVYHASLEELSAIDEADRSGVASDEEVEAAFKTFRRT